VQRAGATAGRVTVTSAAARRAPEIGSRLRAASARQCLSAPVQGRAGSPSGRSRCVPTEGERTGRTTVTPDAKRRPPELGVPLRADAARKGLPSPLQCRAGNPERGTLCVQRVRATAARATVTTDADRRPPELGVPLRADAARKSLPAPLQCRAGNP